MSLRLWHARWALPWPAVAACLGLAATAVALTWRQEQMGWFVVLLVALLVGAAVAFVQDDPAAAVTRVTARGSRWATVNRLVCAALVAAVGLGLIALGLRGEVGGPAGWPLVIACLSLAVTAAASWLVRRHRHTPGAAVASAVVLLGLVPLVARGLLGTAWPYPSPDLSDGARTWWLLLGAVSLAALAWGLLRPLPSPVRHLDSV